MVSTRDFRSISRSVRPIARGFRGLALLSDPMEVMASPPTLTVGANGAVSAITGAANATVSIAGNDARLTWAGGPGSPVSVATGYYLLQSSSLNPRYQRVRFQFTGRRFEFRIRPASQSRPFPSVRVDGKLITTAWVGGILSSGSADHLILVDFGANTETANLMVPTVSAGGSGHAVGDVVTMSGGTGTAATVRVVAVSGGAVTAVRMESLGSYSAQPSNPVSQGATTGAGTGLQLNFTRSYSETTTIPRNVEISLPRDCFFGGLNIDTDAEVYPWAEPLYMPRRVWIGDSYLDGSNYLTTDGAAAVQASRRLGDCVDWFFGIAGMGFVGGTPTTSGYTAAITGMVTTADRIVYALGTNDAGQSAGAITAAVTARLNLDLAAAPTAIITMLVGFSGIGATEVNAYVAGIAACSDPARVGYVDCSALMATNVNWRKSSDNVHPTPNGHAVLGRQLAAYLAGAEAALLAA